MELKVNLVKGDRVTDKTDYRDNLPVNMYAVARDILGAPGYMLQYPGLTEFGTGYSADRGGVYNERLENHFRVSGTKFIEVDETGTVTILGDITGSNQATLEDFYSFNTQGIIADGKMYLYEPVGGLVQIDDEDIGTPIDGVWIDGYYFLTDGEYIYHTDISDETAIDPLRFATAEFMPDPTLGVGKTADNKAIVFGRYTIEYFYDEANENFAFTRIPSKAQRIGIVATHAKCRVQDIWYILGGAKGEPVYAYVTASGISKKISTREIDKILGTYTEPELSNIRVESVSQDNTTLILFHLPDEVICYNATIAKKFGDDNAWIILKSYVEPEIEGDKYRGINGVFDPRVGKWVYGDKFDGKLGTFDDSVGTQYENTVEWILYSPFLKLRENSIDTIEIDTIPGHTETDDAAVYMSLTYDGVSYGDAWEMDYGQPEEYEKRFILNRLGYVNNWVGFRFSGESESRMAFALMVVEYS
jgi:hypothetical protein